jgi:hypothetical protein
MPVNDQTVLQIAKVKWMALDRQYEAGVITLVQRNRELQGILADAGCASPQ